MVLPGNYWANTGPRSLHRRPKSVLEDLLVDVPEDVPEDGIAIWSKEARQLDY